MDQQYKKLTTEADAYEWFSELLNKGLNFHPDTRARDYVDEDGKRTYGVQHSLNFDAMMAKACALDSFDVYEVAVRAFMDHFSDTPAFQHEKGK